MKMAWSVVAGDKVEVRVEVVGLGCADAVVIFHFDFIPHYFIFTLKALDSLKLGFLWSHHCSSFTGPVYRQDRVHRL